MQRGGLEIFSLQVLYQPRHWKNTFTSKHIHNFQTVRRKPDKGQPLDAFKHFYIDSYLRYKAASELKSPLTQTLFFIIMHL